MVQLGMVLKCTAMLKINVYLHVCRAAALIIKNSFLKPNNNGKDKQICKFALEKYKLLNNSITFLELVTED